MPYKSLYIISSNLPNDFLILQMRIFTDTLGPQSHTVVNGRTVFLNPEPSDTRAVKYVSNV